MASKWNCGELRQRHRSQRQPGRLGAKRPRSSPGSVRFRTSPARAKARNQSVVWTGAITLSMAGALVIAPNEFVTTAV